jgi:hypothetical protein
MRGTLMIIVVKRQFQAGNYFFYVGERLTEKDLAVRGMSPDDAQARLTEGDFEGVEPPKKNVKIESETK